MAGHFTHFSPGVTADQSDGLDADSRSSASTLSLLRRLTDELLRLFRQEVSLATAEVSRSLSGLLLGALSVATAGAVIYAGFVLLLVSAVFGLALVVPVWLAALAVGLAVSLVGLILLMVGRRKLSVGDLVPKRSRESLLRDKDVLTRKIG